MNREETLKSYLAEKKEVKLLLRISQSKKRGEFQGGGGKVSMLLKTHVEKMSAFCLAKMLMKTKAVTEILPRC